MVFQYSYINTKHMAWRRSKNNDCGNQRSQNVMVNDPKDKVYWNLQARRKRKVARRKSAKRQKNLEYLIYTIIIIGAIYSVITH